MGIYRYTYLAQAYGNGNYGNCSYNTAKACSATNSGTTSNSNSPLANTGLAIAFIVTITCFILFAAILVRWWRRPRKPIGPARKADDPTNKDTRA